MRQNNYYLQWKGQKTGPFSLDQVIEMLQSNEIGVMHQIGGGSDWMTLQDFLIAERQKPLQEKPAPRESGFRQMQEQERWDSGAGSSRKSGSRRASSGNHPAWIAGVVGLVVVAIIFGYFLVGRVNDPYRTLSPLDVAAYLDNSNSLRGNSYKITGAIWNSLAWSPTVGRLFSIEVDSANGSASLLPLLVPSAFNHVNIQKGQHFIFKIEVDEKGILKVSGLNKA